MHERHLDESRLTLGLLDDAAIDVFSRGGCIALAVALHDSTGWPILAVTDAHNQFEGRLGGGSSLHWGVCTPDGRFLDVEGCHDLPEIEERFAAEADEGRAVVATGSRDDAIEWHVESAAGRISISTASSFVEPVLASFIPKSDPGR